MHEMQWVKKYATIQQLQVKQQDNKEVWYWIAPNGKEVTLKKATVTTLRGFCNRTPNAIRQEDGKSFRKSIKDDIEEAIIRMKTRLDAEQDPRPWLHKKAAAKKSEDGKAVSVNMFRLCNVMFHTDMDEQCLNRGKQVDKNALIAGTGASVLADEPFYKAAMELYNKDGDEKIDELVIDDIVVDEKEWPEHYNKLTSVPQIKRIFKKVMNELDSIRQEQDRSGTNDSDGEEEEIDGESGVVTLPVKTKAYLLYWNALANEHSGRFDNFNKRLKQGVYREGGKSQSKSAPAKKKDSTEMLVASLDRSTEAGQNAFKMSHKQAKKRDKKFFQSLQVDQIAKLREQRSMLDQKRSDMWKEAMDLLDGSQKDRKKEVRSRLKAYQKGDYSAEQLSNDTIIEEIKAIVEYDEAKEKVDDQIFQLEQQNDSDSEQSESDKEGDDQQKEAEA
ncbi:MAG: hypothetical protein SGARI_001068 [Bacillariaceae sp.]